MPKSFNPDVSLIRSAVEAQKDMPYQSPFVASFEDGNSRVRYIAAKHEGGTGSPTLKTVLQAFDEFKPQVVIVEGLSDQSVSPAWYLEHCRRQAAADFKRGGGEGAYATVLAGERGIDFVSGEPSDTELCRAVLDRGFTAQDFLGWHMCLMLQQHARKAKERGETLSGEEILAAIEGETKNGGKRFGLTEKFGLEEFLPWYSLRMGKHFNLDQVPDDKMQPDEKGDFLQKVAHATDQARDPHIVRVIAEQLEKYDRVLVVYGSAHLMKEEPTLRKMIGKPAYMKPF